MEKYGKDKLLYMQLASGRDGEFGLTEMTVGFVEEFGLANSVK
jgi:hypothetical protein